MARTRIEDLPIVENQSQLAAKVCRHVTAGQVEASWAARQSGYERLPVALVLVGREELAREVASQVREDGRDLAEVAREHGLELHRGERFRKELDGPLADALDAAPRPSVRSPPRASSRWRWSRTIAPPSWTSPPGG